jgi:hypothetical protein
MIDFPNEGIQVTVKVISPTQITPCYQRFYWPLEGKSHLIVIVWEETESSKALN